MTSRRTFFKQTAAGAVAISLAGRAAAGTTSNKVPVGVIGTGGMGSGHVRSLASRDDVEVAYVCDVDSNRRAAAAKDVASRSGKQPQAVGDLRRVLDDPRIEAVFIATPDHWHAPAAILALDAGKHVYVEKPCCHNIREGRLMVDAVQRSGKHLQVGTQSRSTDCVREAMQRIQEGGIGEILVAKAWNSQRRGSIGHRQEEAPPDHLDFDTWVGPAPMVPYRPNLLHGVWRWWYDFGCGDIGNDGVHDIDVAVWGLGVQDRHPETATCLGGKYFFDDDQQFPDTQYAVFNYPVEGSSTRKKQLIFEQRIWSPYVQEGYENGAAFYGTEGLLVIGHTVGWRLYAARNELKAERTGGADLSAHHTDFLQCLRGEKKETHAPATVGHHGATLVHLANIAARTGRLLQFNPQTEQIENDAESNALVRREYRSQHWAVPAG